MPSSDLCCIEMAAEAAELDMFCATATGSDEIGGDT
jgi:hypothetical protein